jgi:hypothetical protein
VAVGDRSGQAAGAAVAPPPWAALPLRVLPYVSDRAVRWPRTTYDVTCDTKECRAELLDVEGLAGELGDGEWLVFTDDDGVDHHYCPNHAAAAD